MTAPAIRPMASSDVDAATEMILSNDWGVRRDWLAFATSQPACVPLVAVADGSIVATGVGTANGSTGWIGTIFVAPVFRRQGLGCALTQAIIDRLDSMGCRSLALVATSEGRRLYERMGFEVQTRYRILEAPGLPPAGARAVPSVRAFAPEDLVAMGVLDAEATGEDRLHALARLSAPDTARVAVDARGALRGFVVRPPWGGGATIAASTEDALALIAARRVAARPEGRVRVGILAENLEGRERLVEAGFAASWSAPRMIRGAPVQWHPERIWGQFNHAMG